MFRPLACATSRLVIAPYLVFGSALAPLHAHGPDAGHSHALVHSHVELHDLASHDDEGPEFGQPAERVVWLNGAILHQTVHAPGPEPANLAASVDAIPPETLWSSTPFDDVAPVHGPPRGHPSFRGPPTFLA